MKIHLSDDLLEYLRDKGATVITVDKITSKSCCGSGLPSSDVYLGQSKRKDKKYNIYEVNNVEVFIDKDLFFIDDIRNIELLNLPLTKSLTANFLDYKKLI